MEKKIIFFSHSSKDAEMIGAIKKAFVEKTASTYEVFLSSDGQSIDFGTNWISRVEEALKKAKLFFVFLTPNSLGSDWVNFEAGHAYSSEVKVIPIGIGLDIGELKPPLSLLQGFNITSENGLNNIISVSNKEFNHTHKLSFNKSDFNDIFDLNSFDVVNNDFFSLVEEIRVSADDPNRTSESKKKVIFDINQILQPFNLEKVKSDYFIQTKGMRITNQPNYAGGGGKLMFYMAPLLFKLNLPYVQKIFNDCKFLGDVPHIVKTLRG